MPTPKIYTLVYTLPNGQEQRQDYPTPALVEQAAAIAQIANPGYNIEARVILPVYDADSFGARFKRHRLAAGLSQPAALKVLGVARRTVQRWEAGTHEPSAAQQREAIRVLEAPIEPPTRPFITMLTPDTLWNFHFLRAWVLKERHSRGCLCSYCKDFAPHHAGIVLPINKGRTSWRVIFWHDKEGRLNNIRFTLP